MEQGLENMPEGVLTDIPALFDYFVTAVNFLLSLVSIYSSKFIAAHRVLLF